MSDKNTKRRRDIATAVMAGFCANPQIFQASGVLCVSCDEDELVRQAVLLADRLLEALAEKPQTDEGQ